MYIPGNEARGDQNVVSIVCRLFGISQSESFLRLDPDRGPVGPLDEILLLTKNDLAARLKHFRAQ